MENEKIFTGQSEDEVWQQVNADMDQSSVVPEYKAVLEQGGKQVLLEIDVDPGGGFESGYATTSFSAPVLKDFRFAIHKEGLLDEAGKLFGMQDVVIGYPEFDKKMIIKTNDETKVRSIFADEGVRNLFGSLNGFTLRIVHHSNEDSEEKMAFLELIIDDEITDPDELKKIYHAYYAVLLSVDA